MRSFGLIEKLEPKSPDIFLHKKIRKITGATSPLINSMGQEDSQEVQRAGSHWVGYAGEGLKVKKAKILL